MSNVCAAVGANKAAQWRAARQAARPGAHQRGMPANTPRPPPQWRTRAPAHGWVAQNGSVAEARAIYSPQRQQLEGDGHVQRWVRSHNHKNHQRAAGGHPQLVSIKQQPQARHLGAAGRAGGCDLALRGAGRPPGRGGGRRAAAALPRGACEAAPGRALARCGEICSGL